MPNPCDFRSLATRASVAQFDFSDATAARIRIFGLRSGWTMIGPPKLLPISGAVTSSDLARKTCTPCRGGMPPLTPAEAAAFLAQVPQWDPRRRRGASPRYRLRVGLRHDLPSDQEDRRPPRERLHHGREDRRARNCSGMTIPIRSETAVEPRASASSRTASSARYPGDAPPRRRGLRTCRARPGYGGARRCP